MLLLILSSSPQIDGGNSFLPQKKSEFLLPNLRVSLSQMIFQCMGYPVNSKVRALIDLIIESAGLHFDMELFIQI